MDDRSDDLNDLMNRARIMPAGKTRAALWAQAATLAEEEGNLAEAVSAYIELCSAYQRAGEITRVIAPFMWLDRMRRDRPDLFTESHIHRFGWFYKFVLLAVANVPTIPVSQWESILEQMRTHYSAVGDSMRAYYYRLYQLHTAMGEEEAATKAFDLWISAEHSDLTDCQGCAPGQIVCHYSDKAQWQEAVKIGEEALAGEARLCSSQPEALLSEMLEPWLHCGDDAQAWSAHVRSYRTHQSSPRHVSYLHYHLKYLTLSAQAGRPQRLERALRILCRHLPWLTETPTPGALRDLSVAAALVCEAVPAPKNERILPVTLPGEELEWLTMETLVDPTIAQMRDWMERLARAVAEEFDERPGNRAAGLATERLERALHPEPVASLPECGPMQDVTGLGDYHSTLSFTLADTVSATQRNCAAFTESAQACSTPDKADARASFVPLPLHGSWETMSFRELLSECATAGIGVPTMWAYTALEHVWSAPELVELEAEADLPQEVVSAWRWLRYLAGEAFVPGYSLALHEMETDDPAFRMLNDAQVAMSRDDFDTAIEKIHEAFATQSAEPLGLRLRGLRVWSDALRYQGSYDEAITVGRERMNCAALVGLPVEMASAAVDLTFALLQRGDVYYAAEVAQNGLDACEHYPHADGITVKLHFYSARAHASIGQDVVAANHYLQAAAAFERHGQEVNAANLMYDAGLCLRDADEYGRALSALSQSCDLARRAYATSVEHYRVAAAEEEREAAAHSVARVGLLLARCLHDSARTISWQPDPISDRDHECAKALMEELRTLTLSDDYLQCVSIDPQEQEGQWYAQMAEIHANCSRNRLAHSCIDQAINRLKECGDKHGLATALVVRANLLCREGALEEALGAARESSTLLADTPREESAVKARAEELIRVLDETASD